MQGRAKTPWLHRVDSPPELPHDLLIKRPVSCRRMPNRPLPAAIFQPFRTYRRPHFGTVSSNGFRAPLHPPIRQASTCLQARQQPRRPAGAWRRLCRPASHKAGRQIRQVILRLDDTLCRHLIGIGNSCKRGALASLRVCDICYCQLINKKHRVSGAKFLPPWPYSISRCGSKADGPSAASRSCPAVRCPLSTVHAGGDPYRGGGEKPRATLRTIPGQVVGCGSRFWECLAASPDEQQAAPTDRLRAPIWGPGLGAHATGWSGGNVEPAEAAGSLSIGPHRLFGLKAAVPSLFAPPMMRWPRQAPTLAKLSLPPPPGLAPAATIPCLPDPARGENRPYGAGSTTPSITRIQVHIRGGARCSVMF